MKLTTTVKIDQPVTRADLVMAIFDSLVAEGRDHRIMITGGPSTGKTTLANMLSEFFGGEEAVLHTDSLIDKFDWSGMSEHIAQEMDRKGPWIIEGVAGARSIRKWAKLNPGKTLPIEAVIYLDTPVVPLEKQGQENLRKSNRSIWWDIRGLLVDAGVVVIETEFEVLS